MNVMERPTAADAAGVAGTMLVLVHPGSACGSTDFHHGDQMGSAMRLMLADRLRRWNGPLLVIDGELSDEIVEHIGLLNAIETAMTANLERGNRVERITACDFTHEGFVTPWTDDVREALLRYECERILLTGAWYHPEDDGGCVNAVYDLAIAMGMAADIDDSAISIDPL